MASEVIDDYLVITQVITHYLVITLPKQGSNCCYLTHYQGNYRVITLRYQVITQYLTQ